MAHDASFKDIFGSIAREKNFSVSSSVKVGKLPLEIDMVVEKQKETDFSVLQPLMTIFEKSGSSRLIIEFKSKADSLSLFHVRKLIAYRQLYLMTEDLWEAKGTSVLIFIVSKPRKLLRKLNAISLDMGIYQFTFDQSLIFMIVANEIRITLENLGFAIFTNSVQKSRQLVDLLLQIPYEERFLSFFMVVNYRTAVKVLKEKDMNSGSIIMKNIRLAIEDLGLKNVIKEIGLSRVIEDLGLENVIREVGLENVIREVGLENVIREVGLENVIREVGLENVIKVVGPEKVIEAVDSKELAKNLPVDILVDILKELPLEDKKKLLNALNDD